MLQTIIMHLILGAGIAYFGMLVMNKQNDDYLKLKLEKKTSQNAEDNQHLVGLLSLAVAGLLIVSAIILFIDTVFKNRKYTRKLKQRRAAQEAAAAAANSSCPLCRKSAKPDKSKEKAKKGAAAKKEGKKKAKEEAKLSPAQKKEARQKRKAEKKAAKEQRKAKSKKQKPAAKGKAKAKPKAKAKAKGKKK